ncbi:hypothetical protein HD554DRAFT_2040083 [Boletus coccyginus]|nr:hypothetical protein HD554DRAFT_2040083 [Boletus coccyginus]
MMRARQPNKPALDLLAFAPRTLAHSEGLTAALRMLESCLAGPDIPLDLIVQNLCTIPNLFEFIVSALPSAEGLVHRIMDTYPTDPVLVEASSASMLLRRLSSIIFAFPPDLLSADIRRRIERHKIYVEDALPVLALSCSTDFSTSITAPASVLEVPEYNDEGFSGYSMRNKNTASAIDVAPFHKLAVKVPLNNEEASKIASEISDNLKMILKVYLELLLEPFLERQLRDAYVSTGGDTTVRPSVAQESKVIGAVKPKLSAYPKVQPMKAALGFENADRFGEWRIIIGTEATKKLRGLANGDRKKCITVVKKIKQLSKGHFSKENQKRLNSPSSFAIPIFEAKVQQGLRLVYQVDVAPDHDGEVDRQVIKIYGIYTHTEPNRNWDTVGQQLAGKGEEYLRRCIVRTPVHAGSDIYLPACFPQESLQNDAEPTLPVLTDGEMEESREIRYLFSGLIADQDVQHVFELAPRELQIVECKTSCYVLGRSGTGYDGSDNWCEQVWLTPRLMFGIQRTWEMEMSGMPKPRQIFVTKSRFLATKVQEYFTKLLESSALVGYSIEELKKMRLRARDTESGLVDGDDEDQTDIPQRYSALEEDHFPLFVTFDKLARMIAADVLGDNNPEARHFAKFFINTDDVQAQNSFVTYGVFARTYWPHFSQQLTKGLEPWLAFSELMGIIKGSEKSLSYPDGCLDEEAYCSLPARSNPTFANQRRTLYAIFKAYSKLKKERRHHDVADRTHAILKTLMGGIPLRGQKVDFLYVDEAQDNLLIDALLLRLLCRNPNGLFWAGDTAQTISAGSSFRFDDLKAFLYRIEVWPYTLSSATETHCMTLTSQHGQSKHLIQDRSVTDPTPFQLTVNYRSHGGIAKCAHTVIERITRFWPNAIDGLQREKGTIDGLRPKFFRGWDQDTVQYEQLLFGTSESRIEFGAHQCILVRDDEAVEKLKNEVGEIGLIMTLYDSKGLEFNDALLYNFFEDSAIDALRWRVLLNHAGEVDGQDLATVHAPSFERDESRFAGLCSELKMLYVGITRARKKLWIFDKSDKSEPMRMIWTARNQVENCTPEKDIPRLAVSSGPAEWERQGHDLFKHKKYPKSMYCFTKAKLPRMVAICQAFHLREVARAKVGVAPQKDQQDAFLTAAKAFMASGNDAPRGKDKLQYYRNAADCYVRAEDDLKAADAYLDAQEYDLAARRFRKVGLFDKTLEVIRKHSKNISPESLKELETVCRLFYCSKRDVKRPRLPLFSCLEEELKFLETYDLDVAPATSLENHGRYLEAAELHLSENRPLDAIRDLLKEKGSRDAIQQATKIVLDGLWRRCSFGIMSNEVAADRDVGELLNLAGQLPLNFLDSLDRHEVSMFRAIARADLVSLEKLSHSFVEGKRKSAALLALDHFFSRPPVIKSHNLLEMSQFLNKFREYTGLLHDIIYHPDPLSVTSIKRLFSITEISNTEYRMEPGSFLHSSATGDRHGPMYLQPSVVSLSKREIVTALKKYLAMHLCKRVTKENELCCDAMVFSQCLTFIVHGQCERPNCPQEHVKPADLDSKRYNLRIGIHLQQIRILQLMYSVNPRLDRRECVLHWLTHLYESFKPQSHVQGSIANLDLSMIPGARESIGVMKHWVRDALYTLCADNDRPAFLTTVLKLTSLIFAFDESGALKCVNQAHFNAHHARVKEFVYSDGCYVFEDIASLFDGTRQTCISAGLKVLGHVLKSDLRVDLSVFCDCLEEVVGKASISWRLSFHPPLDGLVLPRGWLSSNKALSMKKDIRPALIVDVLNHVQDLLISLQSDDTSLIYNVRIVDVRNKVKNIFDVLRTAGTTQRLYRKYVQPRNNLNEYLKVMVEYDADAKVVIQDLVQLLHKQRDPSRGPPLRLQRIQHIYFANPSEIPSLLVSQLVLARSDLGADAPAFTSRVGHAVQSERAEDDDKTQLEEPEVDPEDEAHEEPQELAPAPNEPALVREHEPTEEEIAAAKKIQATYRTYRKHHEAQTRAIGKGLKAQRNTIFLTCLKNVITANWRRTPYRTLYLWALPHLVVCLDKTISIAHELKSKTKGLLLKRNHERLEELGKQSNRINALLSEGHDLRKNIDPNAAMHQAKDGAAMKKAVLDVKDFIHRLPSPSLSPNSEILKDFHVAYKLVMIEKQSVPKREKPTLNTEDLFE